MGGETGGVQKGGHPRFRPRHTKGGPGGLPTGLGHSVQRCGPGACALPPCLGHSAWN